MNRLTTLGWYYMVFGLATCGFFSAAAIGKWQSPNFDSGGNSYMGGSSYGRTTGSSFGRTTGGSWGGGK